MIPENLRFAVNNTSEKVCQVKLVWKTQSSGNDNIDDNNNDDYDSPL